MDDLMAKLKLAPLIHKWFARRRPEAVSLAFDALIATVGEGTPLAILDPFAGSGSLLLEVKRRGHNFYGVDVNPVAALIADYTLNPPETPAIERAFASIDAKIGERIRSSYQSEVENLPAEGVTYFRSREIVCSCGAAVELHHNWLIARSWSRTVAVYLCPACKSVFQGGTGTDSVQCPDCGSPFDWRIGTIKNNVVACPSCGTRTPLLGLPDVREKPRHKLVAVEVFADGKRTYKRPSTDDIARADGATDVYNSVHGKDLCDGSIPVNGRFDPRPVSHGFTSYGDLFTKRQLWAIGLIAEQIRDWPHERERGALALALSDAAGSNNLLCRYAADWMKLTPAFGIHGYHPVSRPVEGNVWGATIGRGSFKNCVRKAIRAYQELSSIPAKGSGTIVCGDARNLDIPDNSIDAVFTDPPYFDYLDYADLSDFYFQWLRICLPEHPWFVQESARVAGDISRMRGQLQDSFSWGLAAVFEECLRVLRPGGPIVFSYHHSAERGWWQLLSALQKSGLVVADRRLVRSELENGFHSSPGNIKNDAIFVCVERRYANRVHFSSAQATPRESDRRMALCASAVETLSWTSEPPSLDELKNHVARLGELDRAAVLGVDQIT